jgi:hypothetical protein
MERKQSESPPPWISATVLVAFGAFSCWVGATDPWGWLPIVRAAWGAQITLDLCIAVSLLWTFILRDARYRHQRLWPWMLATIPLGSIAPLGFLLWNGFRARERAAEPPSVQPARS